jgi:hypothetical protein
MQQWEYKLVATTSDNGRVVAVDSELLERKPRLRPIDYLNQLGREGWEVVGFSDGHSNKEYVLKRPLAAED